MTTTMASTSVSTRSSPFLRFSNNNQRRVSYSSFVVDGDDRHKNNNNNNKNIMSSSGSGRRGTNINRDRQRGGVMIIHAAGHGHGHGSASSTERRPGENKGFVEEMRFVAMKLHTREQAPKEGQKKAEKFPNKSPWRNGSRRKRVI